MLDALTFVKTPKVASLLFSDALWKVNTFEKKLYLTFDDGPIPEVTEWVLDQLSKYDATATFFVVGNNVEKNPGIFSKILTSGHRVGNHTADHLNGWKVDAETYLENVAQCHRQMTEAGFSPAAGNRLLFRPPYMKVTPNLVNSLKDQYLMVMWDVISGDFDTGLSPWECYQKTNASVSEGSIVVMHDSLKAEDRVKFTLPRILEKYASQGWIFRALPH